MSDDDRDPADIRAVLREHGHEPPARGKLSRDWLDIYDAIRAGQDGGPPPEGSYDGGVTVADFPPDEDEAAAGGVPAERAPRKPRATRKPLTERLKAARGKAKAKPKGKPRPRVPVDRVVGMVWEALGRMFTPLSAPTGRCLQLQAPVAGLILEDVVKGTVADRVLQPIARAEEKGKKVFALAAPPAIVLAIEQSQAAVIAGRLTEQQYRAREAILLPMLQESLMMWDDVAGEKIEAQMARDAERGPARERAQRIMRMIFAPPTAGPGTPSPEDEAAAAAQAAAMAGAGL